MHILNSPVAIHPWSPLIYQKNRSLLPFLSKPVTKSKLVLSHNNIKLWSDFWWGVSFSTFSLMCFDFHYSDYARSHSWENCWSRVARISRAVRGFEIGHVIYRSLHWIQYFLKVSAPFMLKYCYLLMSRADAIHLTCCIPVKLKIGNVDS